MEMKTKSNKSILIALFLTLIAVSYIILVVYNVTTENKSQNDKTILFHTKNSIKDVKIIVKNGKDRNILSTNSLGEATFIVPEGENISYTAEYNNSEFTSDRNLIRYNTIENGHDIWISLIPNKDLSKRVKVISDGGDIIEDAIFSNDEIRSQNYSQEMGIYNIIIDKRFFKTRNIKLGDNINFTVSAHGFEESTFNFIVEPSINEILEIAMNSLEIIDEKVDQPIELSKGEMVIEKIHGCLDSTACNYSNVANIDDGNCIYAMENYDCNDSCVVSIDCASICGGASVEDECGICDGDGSSCAEKIYNYYLISQDSYNDEHISGLIFSIKELDGRISEEMPNGKYLLTFNELEKEFTIIVRDPSSIYEEKTFTIFFSEKDIDQENTITIFQITNLLVNTRSHAGEVLSNSSILINDKLVGITNNAGDFLHRLRLSKEKINLNILQNGHFYEEEEIFLKPGSNTHISYLAPIIQNYKILDSVTGELIEGLKIDTNNNINYDIIETNDINVYRIHFEKLGINSLIIYDPSGEYQDSEYNVDISSEEIGATNELLIHKMTYLTIEILDKLQNPIPNVTVIDTSQRNIGISGEGGKIRKKIKFLDNTFRYSINFPNYYVVDTLINIVPGENIITQSLRKLPDIQFHIIDEHSENSIQNLLLLINNTKYYTDEKGEISISPKTINEKYTIQYDDGGEQYFKFSDSYTYSLSILNHIIKLKPVLYLHIKTYYLDGDTPMTGVNITLNHKKLTSQEDIGSYDVKIPSLYDDYIIKAGKIEYEVQEIIVTPSEIHTDVVFTLDQLTETIMIVNVFDNPIQDVTVRYDEKTSIVDKYGKVEIVPKKLNNSTEINFISPEKIYRDTTITFSFAENRDSKKLMLFTNPFELAVTIKNKIGVPANGTLKISPPPNPLKGDEYVLVDGNVNINLYESKDYMLTYDVSFGVGTNKYYVTDNKKIEVDLAEKKMDFRQTIRGAIIKVKTKNNESVDVMYLNNSQQRYTLLGDGKDEIELDDFGDYEFSYQPEGFGKAIKEVRTVNRPIQQFYFVIDENFENGIFEEEKGNWSEAISFYKKVPAGAPKYCESISRCIQINDNIDYYVSTENDLWKYIEAMKNSECDENYSYYFKYLEIVSKIQNPLDTDLENIEYYNMIWSEEGGRVDKVFDRFRNLCPILSDNCEEKEIQGKILILRGISSIMDRTKKIYDVELEIEITSSCKSLNNYLYEISNYYSSGLESQEWSWEKSQIEQARID